MSFQVTWFLEHSRMSQTFPYILAPHNNNPFVVAYYHHITQPVMVYRQSSSRSKKIIRKSTRMRQSSQYPYRAGGLPPMLVKSPMRFREGDITAEMYCEVYPVALTPYDRWLSGVKVSIGWTSVRSTSGRIHGGIVRVYLVSSLSQLASNTVLDTLPSPPFESGSSHLYPQLSRASVKTYASMEFPFSVSGQLSFQVVVQLVNIQQVPKKPSSHEQSI